MRQRKIGKVRIVPNKKYKEDFAMKKIENHKNNKSNVYVESETMRNDTLDNVSYDFLDKLKVIPYLTDDMVLTVDQVATYYEVTTEAIKTIIKRNRGEFENDGMVVLTGEDLKDFIAKVCEVQSEPSKISPKTRSLTLVTKRSLLRVGMLLTNSELAKDIRDYLLNIEESTDIDRKSWAIQREVGIRERKRMTSAISRYIPESKHKRFAYPNYTNMIYKIIFGCDAKTLRQERNVKTNDALRDSFTESELKKVEEVETIVTGLISMDFTYKQIEEMLKQRFIKKIS